jgi:hypothetical protein
MLFCWILPPFQSIRRSRFSCFSLAKNYYIYTIIVIKLATLDSVFEDESSNTKILLLNFSVKVYLRIRARLIHRNEATLTMKMPMRATPKIKMMKKARIRKTMTRSNSMGRLACSSPFLVSRCQIWRGSSIGFRGNLHGAGTVTWSSDLVDHIMTGVLVD